MAHHSVRITHNKPIEKFTEKDWEKVEQQAAETFYKIAKSYMLGFEMSEGKQQAVIEYDIVMESPRVYQDKENRKRINVEGEKE